MPTRKRLRLEHFDYSTAGAYFVTVCARDREFLFGEILDGHSRLSPIGQIVAAVWGAIPNCQPGASVDAFVVMPNHVHGIVWLTNTGQSRPALSEVIRAFKARTSRYAGRAIWQRSFHERVIRDELDLADLRRYVEENPLRWTLDRDYRPAGRDESVGTFTTGDSSDRQGRMNPAPTNPRRKP